ncbi:hypothetical protein RRG08_043277 [Elysia crispata]|uniref:Uncharacterized protein n=1 Tax=Elysia crispata TaxID=231223 RepID=A0AAE0XY14_9GAST|nr:hypothetical protein RRG08_043277 [Elysia crispata]
MCMTLRAPCLRRTFSGRGSSKSLHSADCRFVSGSQEYTQVSSPATKWLQKPRGLAVKSIVPKVSAALIATYSWGGGKERGVCIQDGRQKSHLADRMARQRKD